MEEFNYTGWNEERQLLIDTILETLREQEDQKPTQTTAGSYLLNPKIFKDDKNHLVVGPIKFGSSYEGTPNVTFGESAIGNNTDTHVGNPTIQSPFILHLRVYSWSYSSGLVDGFYLGMYALNLPAELPLKHEISWQAVGKTQRYKEERLTESWTTPYEYGEPDYLISNE